MALTAVATVTSWNEYGVHFISLGVLYWACSSKQDTKKLHSHIHYTVIDATSITSDKI